MRETIIVLSKNSANVWIKVEIRFKCTVLLWKQQIFQPQFMHWNSHFNIEIRKNIFSDLEPHMHFTQFCSVDYTPHDVKARVYISIKYVYMKQCNV